MPEKPQTENRTNACPVRSKTLQGTKHADPRPHFCLFRPIQWEGAEPGLLVCPKVLNRKSAQPLAVCDPSPCRYETMPILDPILDLSVGGRLTPHDSLHVADSCPRYLFQGFTVCQRCQPFCLYTRTRLR